MKNQPYLVFSLHGLLYAISTERVKEIFLLPELIPIEEAPKDIVGILNWHSKIVPIMHLDLRFGHPFQTCNLTDSVIVLESQGLQIGVIVHQVYEVKQLDSAIIETDLSYGRSRNINSAFVAGIAKVDDDTIVLLDLENLIRHPDAVESLINQSEKQLSKEHCNFDAKQPIRSFYDLCCPQATSKEKAIFKQRADKLKNALVNSEVNHLIGLAILGLNGEYFGLDLQVIKEFIKLHHYTPIPCCPSSIIGNINWRGEIVTLIDIWTDFNFKKNRIKNELKVVIFKIDNLIAGFTVEEVIDVIHISKNKIKSLPLAMENNHLKYLQGVTNYREKMLSILDLQKILINQIEKLEQAA